MSADPASEGLAPGLGSGDVVLAAASSAAVCGLVLGTVMSLDDPTPTYAMLHRWAAAWSSPVDPHRLVGLLLPNAWLGGFVGVLAWRTRTPPLRLAGLGHAPPGVKLAWMVGVPLAAGLLLWGLLVWLRVMLLA